MKRKSQHIVHQQQQWLQDAFATLAIDDKGIGKKTVDIAMDYVNGKEVADIPAQVVGIDYCSVNKSAMKTLGISQDHIKTDYKLNVIEN